MNCQCEKNISTTDIQEESIDLTPLKEYTATENNLITLLQQTQSLYGYLPKAALLYLSKTLGIKPAKLMGVASFYTQFRMAPIGKKLIQLCCGTACHVNGAAAIGDAITETLGIVDGQTTQDGLYTLQKVACLGCCSLSPVMMINGEPYGLLTPESVKKILMEINDL